MRNTARLGLYFKYLKTPHTSRHVFFFTLKQSRAYNRLFLITHRLWGYSLIFSFYFSNQRLIAFALCLNYVSAAVKVMNIIQWWYFNLLEVDHWLFHDIFNYWRIHYKPNRIAFNSSNVHSFVISSIDFLTFEPQWTWDSIRIPCKTKLLFFFSQIWSRVNSFLIDLLTHLLEDSVV